MTLHHAPEHLLRLAALALCVTGLVLELFDAVVREIGW